MQVKTQHIPQWALVVPGSRDAKPRRRTSENEAYSVCTSPSRRSASSSALRRCGSCAPRRREDLGTDASASLWPSVPPARRLETPGWRGSGLRRRRRRQSVLAQWSVRGRCRRSVSKRLWKWRQWWRYRVVVGYCELTVDYRQARSSAPVTLYTYWTRDSRLTSEDGRMNQNVTMRQNWGMRSEVHPSHAQTNQNHGLAV